ncbi:hypothetical protein BC332_28644 [Capsicum chinense]|nr:hypothetical protein BC332_28644 [Capsicum chinense]
MELFRATTITRKIILEGGLVAVDDGSRNGSGSGAAVGANDALLTEMTSKRGVILSKRISYPYTLLQIKVAKRRRKDTSKASSSIEKSKIAMPLSLSCTDVQCERNCGSFVAAYAEYLNDGLQVPNDGLDNGLLCKIYAALLWKYGEVKAQKPYARDIKDPR